MCSSTMVLGFTTTYATRTYHYYSRYRSLGMITSLLWEKHALMYLSYISTHARPPAHTHARPPAHTHARTPPPHPHTHTITKILLKVALNTINNTNLNLYYGSTISHTNNCFFLLLQL